MTYKETKILIAKNKEEINLLQNWNNILEKKCKEVEINVINNYLNK